MKKAARNRTRTVAGPHAANAANAGGAGDEATPAPACGCGIGGASDAGRGRRAVAVDPAIRERNLVRLRRIEGQVRGLQRMIESDRYCADILTQMTSVHEALRGVARELLRNHLKHCASAAIRRGDAEADAMYDELVELMHTHSR